MQYINKLESYKTAIKNLHWSSRNMSEHKLLDDVANSVSDYQDEVAEIAQGIFSKIKINELKPRKYTITNSKKMLNDLLSDTKKFHSSTKSKELIGLRSVVESFIAEVNQYLYLIDFCLKEDIKRNLSKKNINENIETEKQIKLTEKELYQIVTESVNKLINESCWYGDTKPFVQILKAASEIRQKYEYSNNEDYEPFDDCDGRDLSYDIYLWAKKIEDEAENWINRNSSNASINGGENW